MLNSPVRPSLLGAARLVRNLLPLAAALALAACESTPVEPDYSQVLPPGSPALLPLGPNEQRPDFSNDWNDRRSIGSFPAPTSMNAATGTGTWTPTRT